MIDTFKYETEWEENHMVGVHVRRGDLTIYGKDVSLLALRSTLPASLCMSQQCFVRGGTQTAELTANVLYAGIDS